MPRDVSADLVELTRLVVRDEFEALLDEGRVEQHLMDQMRRVLP